MRRKVLIGIGALLLIGVIASLAGGGTVSPDASASPTAAAQEPTPATSEPIASEPASAEPSIEPTAEPTEPAPAAFADIELTGRGDDVVRFAIPEDQPAIVRFTHRGSSNFAIESIAADGSTNELLVNEIGSYQGNHLFDASSHSVAFKITADGEWRALVRSITKARAWDPSTRLEGEGADIARIVPPSSGLVTVSIRHRGESNFAVIAYAGDFPNLLVNEIGDYQGEVLLPDGSYFLAISADGPWTVTPG